ncbi:type II toxin-antitoxin system RelE/ParE family toxin [Bacillus sp. 31A1R]|uniref:Type II toxin-antitoxin system RelE/ParE family toxin n=1 Tax=Robertmurraya mangrovi TaxID=3098077 RepID=A0ABU5J1K6_9BACI|nr:type II toxin-antitoxin system RelE/ParE family toxin [Bacillus sp. 31A1R]MDZ5473300.1 type II toxin-antitoxin system RelE/ParE family toxin [Bacillus sp. 31A1R]
MQQKKQIKYTPAAIDDMDEIFSYISYDNVDAAGRLLENLDHHIGNLASFPNLGTMLSEEKYTLVDRGYRFIVVHPYLVFYKIMDESIIIHRILHGRRDFLRDLFDDFTK